MGVKREVNEEEEEEEEKKKKKLDWLAWKIKLYKRRKERWTNRARRRAEKENLKRPVGISKALWRTAVLEYFYGFYGKDKGRPDARASGAEVKPVTRYQVRRLAARKAERTRPGTVGSALAHKWLGRSGVDEACSSCDNRRAKATEAAKVAASRFNRGRAFIRAKRAIKEELKEEEEEAPKSATKEVKLETKEGVPKAKKASGPKVPAKAVPRPAWISPPPRAVANPLPPRAVAKPPANAKEEPAAKESQASSCTACKEGIRTSSSGPLRASSGLDSPSEAIICS